jgi:SAM-dependent methyltransferase
MTTRDEEIAVYVEEYKNPRYRMGPRRQGDVARILDALPRGSLLDVGTGRGEALVMAMQFGFTPVAGTEVVPDLCGGLVVYSKAHELPFEDQSYDHVTCFDVLEHLVEEDIGPCLAHMRRIARKSCTVSASSRPSVFGGRDLHISKRPAPEWHRLIRTFWGSNVQRIGNCGDSAAFQARF